MPHQEVRLKDTVEIPAKTITVKLGRAPRVGAALTKYSAQVNLESIHLLSNKPLRRPKTRRLSK